MLDGMVRLLPTAEVGFLGMVRDEGSLVATTYATRLPEDLSEREVFVLDPMLATGGTLVATIELLVARGARSVTAICLLSAPEGLARVDEAFRDDGRCPVTVVTAGVDERLDERGYITPGPRRRGRPPVRRGLSARRAGRGRPRRGGAVGAAAPRRPADRGVQRAGAVAGRRAAVHRQRQRGRGPRLRRRPARAAPGTSSDLRGVEVVDVEDAALGPGRQPGRWPTSATTTRPATSVQLLTLPDPSRGRVDRRVLRVRGRPARRRGPARAPPHGADARRDQGPVRLGARTRCRERGRRMPRVGGFRAAADADAGRPASRSSAARLLVTGGAVSPAGDRLVLRTYTDAYVFAVPDDDLVGGAARHPRDRPAARHAAGRGGHLDAGRDAPC